MSTDPAWFIVEDGSGNPNAASYATKVFVDSYHARMGNTYWQDQPDEQRYYAIARATAYIDKRFTVKFKGTRLQLTQALAWPRIGAYDSDLYQFVAVPLQVQRATAEYALRAIMYGTLAPDAPRFASSQDMSATDPNAAATSDRTVGPVRLKRVKVGPIEQETVYDATSQIAQLGKTGQNSRAPQSSAVNDLYIPQYPEADLLLEDLLHSSTSISLVLGG